MKVYEGLGAFFDVDETLVLMDGIDTEHTDLVEIIDVNAGIKALVVPHADIVQKMREHHSRGHSIFVWSAGGQAWAKAVVQSLGLDMYVTAILPKGPWAWDDKQPNRFLEHCYIEPPRHTRK